MGSYARMILALVFLAIALGQVSSRCPPKNWVRGPECREDYDCRKGVCCPNYLGKKSCVYTVAKYMQSNTLSHDVMRGSERSISHEKSGRFPRAVYCEGVKCKPWQVCKPDRYTNKLTCQ